MNPILPLNVYIPDGEPHIFEDRIYLFGSHDAEEGKRYCQEGDYLAWSAPLSDPENWTCHGQMYNASQDPLYDEDGVNDLYAPDVVCGNDGRYYLYYCLTGSGDGAHGHDRISVAVSDRPEGPYEYYGYVKNPDGSVHNTYLMGDPAVMNDDGVIRLYAGWSLSLNAAGAHAQGSGYEGENHMESDESGLPDPGDPQMNVKLAALYQMLFKRSLDQVRDLEQPLMGANAFTLADDMLTVADGPHRIIPGQFDTPKDSSFYGHAFYEASSIRKINDIYYFIYSSEKSHELCYATSKYPDRGFEFGGTIISLGDVGYRGRKEEDRSNMAANNHGSLSCINGQWYIFYHRQTHRSTFSRQACAEPVTIHEDGSIDQVECTSLGFAKDALPASGTWPAVICSDLSNGNMPHCTNTTVDRMIPNITNIGEERFITGMTDGTKVGFKYFGFQKPAEIRAKVRGNAAGTLKAYAALPCAKWDDSEYALCADRVDIHPSMDWMEVCFHLDPGEKAALVFEFSGEGVLDFLEFSLQSQHADAAQ